MTGAYGWRSNLEPTRPPWQHLVAEERGNSQVAGPTPRRRMAQAKVGPGGSGSALRSSSLAAARRASSSLRLVSPRAMAQRWLARKIGFIIKATYLGDRVSL